MSESKKPENSASEETLAKAVSAAIKEGMIAVAAINKAQAPEVAPAPRPSGAKCPDCGQRRGGVGDGCRGKHRMTNVYPKDDSVAEWFTGVTINDANYMSNGPNHFVCVPEDCNVEHLVAVWEANERAVRNGRRVSHNSGQMGRTSNNVNIANNLGFGGR